MAEYLGETPRPDITYTKEEGALLYITLYGGIDGGHHKDWVLDQVARILHGTPIHVKEAKWSDGETNLRHNTGEPTQEYLDWVAECKDGEDGPETYDYNEGIAP